ncbi:PAS domain S-box protein [Metabacillus arenae]|uniref:histidine kinase n=1 Tax=Metabacillus arenae TaxID=2771434 RepID=A0A926NK18_9BACI|nr:PAS domain S-box protein [Metabacillus arenae]MBD1382200.1 PAS domain S-box protein [Metabacillus arenae]
MIIREFFINLSIFSFLVSLALFTRVFVIHRTFKYCHLFGGLYAGIIAAILMFFPNTYNAWIFDLRAAPFILSFVYFGRTAGWITTIFICVNIAYHFMGGNQWVLGEILFFGTALLFTVFKTYFKNLDPIKSVFLYMGGFIGVHIFLFTFFSSLKISIAFEITRLLCLSIGLLISIFLMEAYQKLYRLTQNLSKLNQSLEESKQELKETVHEQQGGIFKFKKENKGYIHTLCDGQFYSKCGVSPEQVVGKDLKTLDSSVIPSHLIPRLLEFYQQAWEGQEVTFELPWPNENTFIFISLRPIKREGKVVEVVGSAIDITERKKMEEELRTTKERLESFIRHNTDAIIIFDLEGHILQVNTAYEKMLGWSIHEIVGEKLPCVPEFLIDRSNVTIQKIISGESITTKLETVRQRKDGSLFEISLTLSPILDSKGNVIFLSAIYRDISERKQIEKELKQLHQQLKESEMKYRVLFEQSPDAVYLVELNEDRYPTRLLEVNPVGCKRFGYSREDLLSMPFSDIVPQNSTMLIKIIEKIREGKRSFTLQNEFVFKKTGKKINTEFSVRMFILNGKEVLLLISRDITERLKTETLLRKSEKLAVVGQLAAAIAHEVNNPLTAMKGFMQLLKLTENENNQRYIDIVLSEMERIKSITNEFITIAKPQAVKIQLNDLHMLLKQATALLQSQATINNIQFRTEFESAVPLITCERNQLKQVFINILKNAIEAMSIGGEVLIQVNKLDDHRVCIRFIDQGCGIPKERIPYLGEPFYSIKEKGIGLGLMICYKIVEAHQGKIVIESEMNKGTIVDVILPT